MLDLIVILLQILSQVLFIAAVLLQIFHLIDKAIATGRRKGLLPNPRQIWKSPHRQSSRKTKLSGREWNQLVTKCHGDVAIAERLINHLKSKNPGHSDRWYIEKAIYDLERDKGRY